MHQLADPTERAWRHTNARPLWAQPPAGRRIAENCERAAALLYEVAYQQRAVFTAAEEINPKILSRCKALLFMFEKQAGIGIKFSRGTGVVVRKLPTVDPGGMWSKVQWSPPIPIETTGGGVGVTLGSNEYGTIYAIMRDGPLSDLQLQDQDITDARPAFNLQSSVSLSGLDLGNRKAAWSFDRTANALVSDKKPVDLVTFRLSNGMMLDMSVATSSMCLDVEEMEKVYPGTRQLADVMDAEAPECAAVLYEAIDRVMKQELS